MIFGDVVASATTSSRRAANIRLRTMITHPPSGWVWVCKLQSCVALAAGLVRRRKDACSRLRFIFDFVSKSRTQSRLQGFK